MGCRFGDLLEGDSCAKGGMSAASAVRALFMVGNVPDSMLVACKGNDALAEGC